MQLERVEKLNLTLSAGAVAATFAFASPHVASSLAIGAALEAMNFGALIRGARIYLGGGVQGSGPWLALFSARFVLLGVGIVAVMMAGAHPVALVCGLSIAIPAVVIDSWLNRPAIDPEAPGTGEWTVPPPDDESWDRYSIWRPQALDEEVERATERATERAAERAAEREPESEAEAAQKAAADRVDRVPARSTSTEVKRREEVNEHGRGETPPERQIER